MTHSSSNQELWQECRRGEPDAFARLVERHQRLVFAVCFAGTGDRALSEDVAQETFIAAWRSLGDVRDPSRLTAWLCGIARNLSRKAMRVTRREIPSERVDVDDARADASPLDDVLERERERIVWAALARIPERYREPLVLCYQEGRSAAEIAGALGLSLAATHQRLSRGRRYLEARIEVLVSGSLRQLGPPAGFVAAVMAAIAAAPATACVLPSTPAGAGGLAPAGGGLTVPKKTVLLASAVAAVAMLVAWCSRPGGHSLSAAQPHRPETRASASVGEPVALPATGSIVPAGRASTPDQRGPIGAVGGERGDQPDVPPGALGGGRLVTYVGFDGDDHALDKAYGNGLSGCLGTVRRSPLEVAFRWSDRGTIVPSLLGDDADVAVEVCLRDQLGDLTRGDIDGDEGLLSRRLADARQACREPVEPLDAKFELRLRDDGRGHRVASATMLGGAAPPADVAAVEQCVVRAFEGVELDANEGAVWKLWMRSAVEQVPPPPEPGLVDALEVDRGPTRGSADAPVTMVVFIDFQCRFSGRLLGTIDHLLDEFAGDLRVEVRNLPVSEAATVAAEAALAAAAQGRYWHMHDLLFANQDALERTDLLRYARELDLDLRRFADDLERRTFRDAVAGDLELARALGVTGAPTALIDGERWTGLRPVEHYRSVIQRVLDTPGGR